MEIGQVIEQTKGIFLSKNYSEKKAGRLVPYVFLFFRKDFYEEKGSGLRLSFNIMR